MRILKFKPYSIILAFILLFALVVMFTSSPVAGSTESAQDDGGNLVADANGEVKVSVNRVTGVASFVQIPGGVSALPAAKSAQSSPEVVAGTFLTKYGELFGVTDATTELAYQSTVVDTFGNSHVAFRQVYQQLPVFAGELKVHMNGNNAVTAANGTFIPKIALDANPTLTVEEAEVIATFSIANFADMRGNYDLHAAATTLYVYRSGLLEGVTGRNHLVYEVEVVNEDVTVREFIYVDAHTGEIVDRISGIHQDLDRKISEGSLAHVVWEDSEGDTYPIPPDWEGGTAQQVLDWNNEADGAAETYYIFASMAGWDSYDNAGSTMRTVNNDPDIACPNALWNGISTNYCSGVTGDDTVAHEWGHAYTEYTNNLIYAWQSGALNESYSDIWGEVVDLLNGRGLDSPGDLRTAGSCSDLGAGSPANDNSYRWLSGESDPAFGGAIRDLWEPNCYNDPGRVTDDQYHCASSDGGGVHTNSGVPNRAFALMVDGDPTLGITGLGLTKAAHIEWAAQNMLTAASNFVDNADALEAACTSLIGADLPALSTSVADAGLSGEVISADDCTEVAEINMEVEFRTLPEQCEFEPAWTDVPGMCEGRGNGTVLPIFSEDWESGQGSWITGTHDIANPASFDNPDWFIRIEDLPGSRAGDAMYVEDSINRGACTPDDTVAGALNLDSPPIVIPNDAFLPRVTVNHYVSTEAGWDGGNLKVSVNGGPWIVVPDIAFDFNGYFSPGAINGGGNDNPLAGEEGWTGGGEGSLATGWGQSQINLDGLAKAGDTIVLRFDMGLDGCNGIDGWYVDEIEVYSCQDEYSKLICGDGILNLGESCDDANTSDSDGCSSVCQVEDGYYCEDPEEPTPGSNVINDGSFEDGAFGGIWDEYSLAFGTPLCDPGSCGGNGASDGAWWTWFGGVNQYEEGWVAQDVIIPDTATELTFDAVAGLCDSADDYMEVSIDGNREFLLDEASGLCDAGDYSEFSVDVSPYADGGAHYLEFHSEIFATNGGWSNFFLDNVVLNDNIPVLGAPSICTPVVTELSCNTGTVGFEYGIPEPWSVVDNAGFGLVWSDIAGSGEGGNYTGGANDAASVSSDAYGLDEFDTELQSNPFSLADGFGGTVHYLANYQNYGGLDFLDLDITSDSGATWDNLLSWNEDHGGFRGQPGEAVAVDLTAYSGEPNLQLRWRYYDPNDDDWDWYAQVDDVSLMCSQAPDCSAAEPSRDVLWAPNHRYVPINILGVTDPDGDDISINIDRIFQDEMVRGRGSGNTGMDGRGVGTSTAEVRAEVNGRSDGRVYHIYFTAYDGNGASCSSVVQVSVPHDMGINGPAVDGGPLFDSTTN